MLQTVRKGRKAALGAPEVNVSALRMLEEMHEAVILAAFLSLPRMMTEDLDLLGLTGSTEPFVSTFLLLAFNYHFLIVELQCYDYSSLAFSKK